MTPNPLKMVLSGVLQASLFLSVAFFRGNRKLGASD